MKHAHVEPEGTKIIRFIVDDRYRFLRHAVLLLSSLVVISFSNQVPGSSGSYKYIWMLSVFVNLITMCYVNMNVLVPKLFFMGRYLLYLISLLLLVVVGLGLMNYLLDTFFANERLTAQSDEICGRMGFYEGTIISASIILITTMIKLFKRWMKDSERMAELKNITLTMELNELRNQINPHFLFNMLNGIKALVRCDQEKATMVIMKLSEFLRYQLYENNEEKTLLRSEINFLSNFLDLEKLRRDNLSIDIDSPTAPLVLNGVFLPPNLFTTFVENAVKHSVNISGAASYIRIQIAVNKDELYFNCVNSVDPDYIPSNGKNSGLGLSNIKRRLKLLYGDNYVLEITSMKNEYHIKLTIPI